MRDNITLFIAIAGFIMSSLTWIRTFWIQRKRLKVTVDFDSKWGTAFSGNKWAIIVFAILFENKSSNPISISAVSIHFSNNTYFRAETGPCFVAHQFHSLVDTDTKWYERFIESANFPLDISSFGSSYQYIFFDVTNDYNCENIASIEISTSRGPVIIDDEETICRIQELFQKALERDLSAPLLSRDVGGVLSPLSREE